MATQLVDVFLYPNLFALHELPGSPAGVPGGDGELVMPPPKPLSSEKLDAGGRPRAPSLPAVPPADKLAERTVGAMTAAINWSTRALPLTLRGMRWPGVYLLENGVSMLLWIGKAAPPQLLQDLLNVPSADRLDGAKVQPPPPSPFSGVSPRP